MLLAVNGSGPAGNWANLLASERRPRTGDGLTGREVKVEVEVEVKARAKVFALERLAQSTGGA